MRMLKVHERRITRAFFFSSFNHDISPIFPHMAFASSEIKEDAYSLIFMVVAYLLRSHYVTYRSLKCKYKPKCIRGEDRQCRSAILKLCSVWVAHGATTPEVKHEHRWWVLEKVMLFTGNPWWTLTDFTSRGRRPVPGPTAASPLVLITAVVTRVANLREFLSAPRLLIVKVTLIYMIIVFVWLDLFLPAA